MQIVELATRPQRNLFLFVLTVVRRLGASAILYRRNTSLSVNCFWEHVIHSYFAPVAAVSAVSGFAMSSRYAGVPSTRTNVG
jgi:hypothetical protein